MQLSQIVARTLTIICRQDDDVDNVRITGVDSLDTDSRRILETMSREVSEPKVATNGFEVSTPTGNATFFARMLASVMQSRNVNVFLA